jgi:hypothetical protein
MNETTSKNPSTALAAGGAGFLALAAFFLVHDLSLPPETMLLGIAILASIAAALARPRRLPWLAPGALLALAVVGGGWYVAVSSPALLPALAATAIGSITAVVLHERGSSWRSPAPAGALTWYAAGAAFLAASFAFYFHFLTHGAGDESIGLRLVPTITWLAVGLALLIAARSPSPPPGRVGSALGAIALLKALIYDSTHLQGPLRVTVFAAVGALLIAGARLVGDREARS